MRNKKSILFVRPDYHCTFIYRDHLRQNGWIADIYVPLDYLKSKVLYSTDGILIQPSIGTGKNILILIVNHILLIMFWLTFFWKYEYHIYYGRPPAVSFMDKKNIFSKIFGNDFVLELWLSKIFKIKLIYLPSGCHDEESKEIYLKIDNGDLCNNCGMFDRCNDEQNNLNFSRIRRYFDGIIGPGSIETSQFATKIIKYKSIDLLEWHPKIKIPKEHQLPATKNIRILHSSMLKSSNRFDKGRDSKGSEYILSAIEKLKNDGYLIEYYFIENKHSSHMKFYQVQADIVLEQLRAGCWGSTGVETMALGKPVVCYLRPSWKNYFFNSFPEYSNLPIIEANTNNIYEILRKLVTDNVYREEKGIESRNFAEKHYDVVKNTKGLIKMLEAL
jgi:hypothetical protein